MAEVTLHIMHVLKFTPDEFKIIGLALAGKIKSPLDIKEALERTEELIGNEKEP